MISFRMRHFGLVAGPVFFLVLLFLPAPSGIQLEAWRTAAAGAFMAVWWITEAVPIPVTSLLPLVLFPILGISPIRETAHPYANPLIFLFMGGFIIAMAMQRWNLHVRMALNIIKFMGNRPTSIIAGFMIATAFLSMWVSNTATTMMMMPIGLSIIELSKAQRQQEHNFAVALMLGIAYSASIGGIGTLIGTPTNALLAGFMSETYNLEIPFANWLMIGLPVVLLGLPLVFFMLTKVIFPFSLPALSKETDYIHKKLETLGPVSRPEKMVAAVFTLVAVLWIIRPLITDWLPGLSDAGIAILGAVLLFLLPVDVSKNTFVLDWKTAEQLPWGVLILFGGGLSLAAQVRKTGLAEWIGGHLGAFAHWPLVVIILMTTVIVILLTELTSNTATAAAFLPIVASVAEGMGQHPLMLAIPAVLAASCAFMLPVATPPNAIVYGSGVLTISQMARAGIYLNILFSILISILAYFISANIAIGG